MIGYLKVELQRKRNSYFYHFELVRPTRARYFINVLKRKTGTNHKLFTFFGYTKDLPRLGNQMIEIDEELCKGCGICTDFCPMKVLETSDKINKKGYYPPKAVKEDECLGCRLCELLCPEFAIFIINE